MSGTSRLGALLGSWDTWAVSANKDEDGWESAFPQWVEVIAEAQSLLLKRSLTPAELGQLERCWLLSEEAEELAEFAKEALAECWEVLLRLASSDYAAVRWQVYSVLGHDGRPAEAILRKGVSDADAYCRRRAILALAQLCPADALDLAQDLAADGDPYIRQAALELVACAGPDPRGRLILERLRNDPVSHVQEAADEKIHHLATEATSAASDPPQDGRGD